MKYAPLGVAFIWIGDHLSYPRDLARSIGRLDIKVFGPSALFDGSLRGRRWPAIVLDHAANLSTRERIAYEEHASRVEGSVLSKDHDRG
jgi:hypothetical protein